VSGKFKFDPVQQRKPAPRPSRLPQQRPQSIPGAEMPPRLRQRDMSPSKLAQLALDAHPEMSNRAIAAEKGVNRMTVCRLRRSTEAYDSIERTIGLDGKLRPARRRSERDAKPTPKGDRFDWAPEREEVVGPPGNTLQDVLARCSSAAAPRRRTPQGPGNV
jgi:hypothetical protein